MAVSTIAIGLFVLANIVDGGNINYLTDKRLKPPPSYAVVAPNRVRPNQVIQVYISIFQLRYPLLNIQTTIRRGDEEVVSSRETFRAASTRMTQLKIPEDAEPGNYTLLVEGSNDDHMIMTVFRNESKLFFDQRHVSCFIFTDQRRYQKRSTVNFRVVALDPDLTPVKSGSIDIYVKVSLREALKPVIQSRRDGGTLKYMDGYLKGHQYSKSLQMNNYCEYILVYIIRTKFVLFVYTYMHDSFTLNSRPVRGNATVEVELKVPGLDTDLPRIKDTYGMINGEFSFNFPMDRLREVAGQDIASTDVTVHANVYDWYGLESQSFSGYSKIISSKYYMRFLGGKVRAFKPGQKFPLHIAMFTKDGRPISSKFNRMVRISTMVQRVAGSTHKEEKTQVISEDSMVHYVYQTSIDDKFIRIGVAYSSGRETAYEDVTAYRHYTQANQYLSVTTSTMQPMVDNYVVFTIVAGGNIILGNQLFMNSKQKTFSLAVSRAMVPEARIIVWTLLNSGEMITDSLSFHVDGVRNEEMKIRINRGKDFSGDTVEINAFTDASAFTAFSVEQEKVYRLGWNSFFTKHMVEQDLMGYDNHANLSFSHTWWEELARPHATYFPAPSFAIDANKTFTFTGLVIVTDAGLTRIDADDNCNHTLGYLPCWDGGCYRIEDHCSGSRQCEEGADELGPYGRIDFHVDVPIWPNQWLVSGFSLDREKGLSFTELPVKLDTTRSFFMIMEVPSSCKRGEQLGVQMSVFNHWDQSIDAIIVLRDSEDYRFIRVEEFGILSSYNPRTTRGDIQTMVTLKPGESKFVHFPILPIKMKSFKLTIEGHSFVNSMTLSKTITVTWDGVPNTRHTPFLVDLVNSGSQVMPFLQIPIPQRFVDPGMRQHRYVPGSCKVKVSIIGDVVGTGLYRSYLTAYNNFDNMMYGNGEHYLYNFATNIYWLRFLDTANYLTTKALRSAAVGSYNICLPTFRRTAAVLCAGNDRLQIWKPDTMKGWSSQSNLTNAYGMPTNVSMTAMVVIGLANARDLLSGEVQSKAVAALHSGTQYLEEWFPRLVDPFEICICAYAFEVARSNYRSVSFAKMREISREDNYVYWSPEKIAANPVEFINAIPYQKFRESSPPSQAKANQATGYALMVYLRNNWFRRSEPIMKWLNSQRNYFAAFDATTAPEAWGAVTCDVQGTGIALYQMSSTVNVEYPHQLRQPHTRAFDLEIEDLVFKGRNSSHMEMNICVRWTATHISPNSGDAILEVDIPTGFFVQKNMLRKYQRVGRIDSQRSRFSKQKVILYFDYLDDVRQCFFFPAERWYSVANMTIQNRVSLYSTYERGFFNNTMYTTYSLFHLHICQVCGSFQCPYCPFYNAAGHLTTSPFVFIICILAVLIVFFR
ncbi:hypothetical protein CAPTEDRAFT_197470 [Capitella teleta]|uniref:Alpha-2-macroglobulin domain-containing protein n=1 Tax=Capitella teleta TaxID=283909 RepID=R7T9S2_CAPTE|nr:hypothetical protein CAPTEDRAFT_197470 [Capitella teleta]|eukprot:ELT90449.1 hypothetical protein CAPTEDRAFT_197470 [Capitella teleta]